MSIEEMEMFEAGQASAIPRIRELEAKNAELEKHNKMLAHQLKYAENILTDVQADKFKLRGNLEIAVEALELIGGKMEYYYTIGDHSKQCAAQEALAAIKDA